MNMGTFGGPIFVGIMGLVKCKRNKIMAFSTQLSMFDSEEIKLKTTFNN